MKRLPNSTSEHVLFYRINTPILKPIEVPSNWHVMGYPSNHIYVRVLQPHEKKKLWANNPEQFLNWDKDWYGAFSVSTSDLFFFNDSFNEIMNRIGESTAVLRRLN